MGVIQKSKPMKKLLFAGLALLSLASCEKKQCYVCTTTTMTYQDGRYLSDQTTTASQCGMTNKDKNAYEKAHYQNVTYGRINVQTSVNCQ
jgi:hypothetical protein